MREPPEHPVVRDVSDLLGLGAAAVPDKLAVVEASGRSVTWRELEDEVGRLATGLGAAGIVAGYRVLLSLGNRIEFVSTYLGVLRAQAVAVPVNPAATPGELARMLADSGARMVVCGPETVSAVREAVVLLATAVEDHAAGREPSIGAELAARARSTRVTPVRVVVVGATLLPGERSFDDLRAESARPVPVLQDPEKLACLLYTSGTSGRPRAAMLTHRALLANVEQIAALEPPLMHGDDVVLGVLPLFHVYGLNAVLGSVLRHRAKLVLVDRFDPQGTLDLIDDEACSVLPVAPPVFPHWRGEEQLAERLGPVRLVLSGSAPLSAEVAAEFEARVGLPVHQGYGLTEAAPVVTSTLASTDPTAGSVGAALPGISLRLVDEAGRPVDGEDPGEILVRGPNLFSGYWPDGADGPDADGWWATGDVGFLDPGGDLTLVDRVKDLVIVSGFNVYPLEVEEVLREVDGVHDAAVIGVPDPETGESVVAYVVAPDAVPGAVEAAVREHAGVRLARFKQPSRVEVVAELPLTVTGKVQKGRLRGHERRRALGLID